MTPTVTDARPRAGDLLRQIGPTMYREAYARGLSLSAYLEQIDPSNGYNDGLDAFGRLLMAANIRTNTIPEFGVFSDRFEKFDESEGARALVPEWVARQWRRAQVARAYDSRALYLNDDQVPGSSMHPYVDAGGIRAKQLAPAIPLSALIALTTPIDSDAYRAFYLTEDTTQYRMVRVAEGTDVPRVKLVGGDHAIRLHKYGRSLETSYEVLRRQPIDKVAFHIARMAIQAETDKVAAVIDILVNGDGNANTAATNHNLTTLDSGATAGTLTLKGWLAFKMKFANPYTITSLLAQEAMALQIMTLNVGSANVPVVNIQAASGFGGFRPINPGLADNVALGWTADAPSMKLVGFDSRFAVERVTEIGSQLQEVERWTTRQTRILTMTEVEGYCVLDQNAIKTLNVNA